MTDRKRDPLPEGYQFGDAGKVALTLRAMPVGRTGIAIRFVQQWGITPDPKPFRLDDWNVIEGEHFTADRDPGDEA